MAKKKIAYTRILLKLSGETLGGRGGFGLDIASAEYIAREVKEAHNLGCEIAIVIGGGNFIRGEKLSQLGIDRPTADSMGMLGTVINALALQSVLERHGLFTRVMSSLAMAEVAEPFIRRRAMRHVEKGRIVVFCAGTGSPYFSTDTAAALRASEIGAEVILKATNVAGVYAADPKTHKHAKLFKEIDPMEMVRRGLKVMDLTAITLSMQNRVPVIVFDVFKKGNLKKLLQGGSVGTKIQ
ncbi:MAG: UMP kinase [Candidatus Sungbacteria bacterium RIFCSPLOWO2_02_FULL_51_17]|uniref:Uridylate kinase n=1 Tax=Candidatus Sungbacteria bacterium RIFCSPHIGHO2_02_FULL_51_29 TaxID=1802273 RepID=A0A1G2KZ86_9BACT|nr:MAG: UMP kinase [Candidatus Sungbacteria bacterium RIFCSPHIGHO2_01_FULL_51_22]OHA03801.1 MAG: UMP kinase [Candidatus Sungbacteria bacterium RIFCSPHIGHO2_02_FULL_51_29]OHA07445.1 MAG: UMP kinase [Candidatus Sungbacteria bacterium RIFCSPLOWO2_01_FULL_51_34]OHA10957.1 MAG: UMP kinase [Candidatus Sungbacteria bacterium RIFCSPLOWO2_02_FULL_51_17]